MSRNTDKGKTIYSSLYLLPRLPFTPDSFSLDSFTLSSPSSVKDGAWGLWSVHSCSSLLLLPPQLFHPPAWMLFMGCRSSWTAPVWAFHLCCSSFSKSLLQHGVLHELQCGFLLPCGLQRVNLQFSPRTEGESLAGTPGAPPPLTLLFSLGSHGCFSLIFPYPSLPCSILPLLTHIISEAPPPWLPKAQPRAVVGPWDSSGMGC